MQIAPTVGTSKGEAMCSACHGFKVVSSPLRQTELVLYIDSLVNPELNYCKIRCIAAFRTALKLIG
jgi:hypothetical protein